MGLSMPEAAATSSYALIATTIIGMLAHVTQSSIAWEPGLLLMAGAVVGSAITPFIMAKFSRKRLTMIFRPILGFLTLLMALSYIF
ncbi:MAG: Hypothetical protein AJITA_00990 [Acetilactobacillus jinshanensis]